MSKDNSNPTIVYKVSDLEIIGSINGYKESSFDSMIKEDLIAAIPSKAVISWNRPDILAEVKRVYSLAKVYFDKHTDGLNTLKKGELCSISSYGEDDNSVYIFDGISWSVRHDCVLCHLQSFKVYKQLNKKQLSSAHLSYPYDQERKIYPIPESELIMPTQLLNNLKDALESIKPIN